MNKELYVYFSTPEPSYENSMAYIGVKKLIETGIIKEENWGCQVNNTESLATVYNRILTSDKVKDKILVLIHSDVIIDDLFVKEKLNARFNRNKCACVVGIAGGKKIKRDDNPNKLWHLMTANNDHMGEVTNNYSDDLLSVKRTTSFGPQGERAILIDGCFMAINVERIMEKNVLFDENCPSKFHFYDLIFSLRCYHAGAEVYVDHIRIIHRSPGLKNITKEFAIGNEYFKDNYYSKLWSK